MLAVPSTLLIDAFALRLLGPNLETNVTGGLFLDGRMLFKPAAPGGETVPALFSGLDLSEIAKDLVHRVDDWLRGPPALEQQALLQLRERPLKCVQDLDHAAAPAVERLLDVADAADRALSFA